MVLLKYLPCVVSRFLCNVLLYYKSIVTNTSYFQIPIYKGTLVALTSRYIIFLNKRGGNEVHCPL